MAIGVSQEDRRCRRRRPPAGAVGLAGLSGDGGTPTAVGTATPTGTAGSTATPADGSGGAPAFTGTPAATLDVSRETVIEEALAANATEFREAFRDSLDARGTQSDGVWRLDAVDAHARLHAPAETTVAFVVGSESFVTGTSVAGEGREVTVRPP